LKARPWECQRGGINPQAVVSVRDLLGGCKNLGTGSGKMGVLFARFDGKGAERETNPRRNQDPN
jgi:hypothetical protein